MSEPFKVEGWLRTEERAFARRVVDMSDAVTASHQWRLTDFMTPREQFILSSVIRHSGLEVQCSGGASQTERMRALIMPENWYPEPEDFEIDWVRVESGQGQTLSHGQVLGTILGTGLDRRKIGDISCTGSTAFLAATKDVVDYLLQHVHQVGQAPVHLEVWRGELPSLAPEYEETTIFVASLRADAVVAQACRWSRSAAQESITRGMVQLNHVPLTKEDESVEVGDLFSIRGFGRVVIRSLEGESKKGRTRVRIGVLPSTKKR